MDHSNSLIPGSMQFPKYVILLSPTNRVPYRILCIFKALHTELLLKFQSGNPGLKHAGGYKIQNPPPPRVNLAPFIPSLLI